MTAPKVKVHIFSHKKTMDFLELRKRMFQCSVEQAIQDMYKQRETTQSQPPTGDKVIKVTLKLLNNNSINVVYILT